MNYSNWYAVQTASGCEKKSQADLRARRSVMGDTFISEIEVPETTHLKINKGGKKRIVKEKILPGYILVQVSLQEVDNEDGTTSMVFPSISHDTIMSTANVLGFAGPNKKKPRRMKPQEVENIFKSVDSVYQEVKQNVLNDYYPGDVVEVIDGPFTGNKVEITSISGNKLFTTVEMCGRMTSVEFTKEQVYKKQ